MMQTEKEKWMMVAIEQAKKALKKDEVPIGAVIVKDNKIVSKAFNKRESKKDATAHAEIIAIKKACKKLKDFRLLDCDIYVTMEPCPMCAGAILNARIKNLYYGAKINKDEALGVKEIFEKANLNHNCEVEGGIFAEECGNIVSNYFKAKRKK